MSMCLARLWTSIAVGLVLGVCASCRTTGGANGEGKVVRSTREKNVCVVAFLGPPGTRAFASVYIVQNAKTAKEQGGSGYSLPGMAGRLQEVLSSGEFAPKAVTLFVESDVWNQLKGLNTGDSQFWILPEDESIYSYLKSYIEACGRMHGADLRYSVLLPAHCANDEGRYVDAYKSLGLQIGGDNRSAAEQLRVVVMSIARGMMEWGWDSGGELEKRLQADFPERWGDDEVRNALFIVFRGYKPLPPPESIDVSVKHGICVVTFRTEDVEGVIEGMHHLWKAVAETGMKSLKIDSQKGM